MTTYMPAITIPSAILEHPASSVLLPIALGTAVGFATRPASGTQKTYMSLRQPPLRPPPWVFGPVWTVLYGVMGYAAHRAFTTGLSPFSGPETVALTRRSMTLYSIQLGMNLIWMPLFFAAKRPVEASVDILGLVGLNGYLAYLWGSIDRTAGLLQIPYLGWLSFATYLCVGAGHLNGWDFSANEVKKE
ncbi:hypothetical protein EsDP_00000658 [Epichloe bromicola]|uniref:Translocator protein n=1 Tax=Epichloe bromicola TaxID=79588 RepID=A0ABQ0CFK6_9HYPO